MNEDGGAGYCVNEGIAVEFLALLYYTYYESPVPMDRRTDCLQACPACGAWGLLGDLGVMREGCPYGKGDVILWTRTRHNFLKSKRSLSCR